MLTWRDVFDGNKLGGGIDIEVVESRAEKAGYKFFAFNGKVHEIGNPFFKNCTVKELENPKPISLLAWIMKTPCQRGHHKFQQYLMRSIPPESHSEIKGNVGAMEIYLEKLTEKVYSVRCQHCGKTPQEINQ